MPIDEDVHARLRVNLEGSRERLDRIGKMFWSLTNFILAGRAIFNNQAFPFHLIDSPLATVRPGFIASFPRLKKMFRENFSTVSPTL